MKVDDVPADLIADLVVVPLVRTSNDADKESKELWAELKGSCAHKDFPPGRLVGLYADGVGEPSNSALLIAVATLPPTEPAPSQFARPVTILYSGVTEVTVNTYLVSQIVLRGEDVPLSCFNGEVVQWNPLSTTEFRIGQTCLKEYKGTTDRIPVILSVQDTERISSTLSLPLKIRSPVFIAMVAMLVMVFCSAFYSRMVSFSPKHSPRTNQEKGVRDQYNHMQDHVLFLPKPRRHGGEVVDKTEYVTDKEVRMLLLYLINLIHVLWGCWFRRDLPL